jgi:ligand-binding sensor domain-containing protein
MPGTRTGKPKLNLWVGTRKGAFVFRSNDRKRWDIEGPFFRGAEINHIVQDPRNRDIAYAAVHTLWFGPHLHVSRNGGKTWRLSDAGLEMKCVPETSLKRIWYIQPGHAEEPGVVWVGGEPGALFRSDNWGQNWHEVPSLTAHPTRSQWQPAMG